MHSYYVWSIRQSFVQTFDAETDLIEARPDLLHDMTR